MGMKIQDINQQSLIIAGIPIDSGRGEQGGDWLDIEYVSDLYTDVADLLGQVSRSQTNDLRADATIRVMSTSEANKFLSALALLGLSTGNGADVGSFFFEDRGGLTKFTGPECWITKIPKISFGAKPKVVEWKVRVAHLMPFIGGN